MRRSAREGDDLAVFVLVQGKIADVARHNQAKKVPRDRLCHKAALLYPEERKEFFALEPSGKWGGEAGVVTSLPIPARRLGGARVGLPQSAILRPAVRIFRLGRGLCQ